jgi:DNA repair exonuclease SbcCD ATPase subunit
MARRRTLPQNIRKYKQEYLRLLAYEARLNHQLFNMKKRIRLLAQEEQLRLTEKALLTEQLQKIQQQKEELKSLPASKQRDTQLKRIEKEYKQVKAKHSRNQYQLDQLEVKKDKDNLVKLLLKEAKRDDVRVRIQSTYETWMRLEQIQQQELAQQANVSDALVATHTATATNQELRPFRDRVYSEMSLSILDNQCSSTMDKV